MVSADEKMMQDRAETGDTGTIFEMESTGETPQKVKLVDPERGASQTLENPSSLVEQRIRDALRETQGDFTGFTE